MNNTPKLPYVKIGKCSKIWHYCNVYGNPKSPVIIGHDTQIGSYSEIKPGVKIGHHCRLQARVFLPEKTIIGNYVFLGPGVIIANDKHPTAKKTAEHRYTLSPVSIDSYATIGAAAVICPGVHVGHHAVVGAGAVVTTNVDPNKIVAGNPARVLGSIKDKQYKNRFC